MRVEKDFVFEGTSVLHHPDHVDPAKFCETVINKYILDIAQGTKQIQDVFVIVSGLLQMLSLLAENISEREALKKTIDLDEDWIAKFKEFLLKYKNVENFQVEVTEIDTSSNSQEIKNDPEKQKWKERADCILQIKTTSPEGEKKVFNLNLVGWYKCIFETKRIKEVGKKLSDRIHNGHQSTKSPVELPLIYDPTVYRMEFLLLSYLTEHIKENDANFNSKLEEAKVKYANVIMHQKSKKNEKNFDLSVANKYCSLYNRQEIIVMMTLIEIRYPFKASEVGRAIAACVEAEIEYVCNETNSKKLLDLPNHFIEKYPIKFRFQFLEELQKEKSTFNEEMQAPLETLIKQIQDILKALQEEFERKITSPQVIKKQSSDSEINLSNLNLRRKSLDTIAFTEETEKPFRDSIKKLFDGFIKKFPEINNRFENYKSEFAASFIQDLERIKNFLVIDNTKPKTGDVNISKSSIPSSSSNPKTPVEKVQSSDKTLSHAKNVGNKSKGKRNKSKPSNPPVDSATSVSAEGSSVKESSKNDKQQDFQNPSSQTKPGSQLQSPNQRSNVVKQQSWDGQLGGKKSPSYFWKEKEKEKEKDQEINKKREQETKRAYSSAPTPLTHNKSSKKDDMQFTSPNDVSESQTVLAPSSYPLAPMQNPFFNNQHWFNSPIAVNSFAFYNSPSITEKTKAETYKQLMQIASGMSPESHENPKPTENIREPIENENEFEKVEQETKEEKQEEEEEVEEKETFKC